MFNYMFNRNACKWLIVLKNCSLNVKQIETKVFFFSIFLYISSARQTLKAMLHEAIFLASRNATMTNKKPFKLQRVCYTLATSFATCNAYNNKHDGGRER